MKCPVCWSEKAYRRKARDWRDAIALCLLLVPFKCHHCFHKFYISWFRTLGQVVHPPKPTKQDRRPAGISEARKYHAMNQQGAGLATRRHRLAESPDDSFRVD
ncbi:MAG: hypothetical protein JW719_13625 [Pirellulales bacterium]|nr:hypothetical protein [Pirellulales bacterium]